MTVHDRRGLDRYNDLYLWMLIPMAIMQIGIFRDYWGDHPQIQVVVSIQPFAVADSHLEPPAQAADLALYPDLSAPGQATHTGFSRKAHPAYG